MTPRDEGRTRIHYGSNGGAECGAHVMYADNRVPAALLTLDPDAVTCPTCRGWLPLVCWHWKPKAVEP